MNMKDDNAGDVINDSLKKIWDKENRKNELVKEAKMKMDLKKELELRDHFAGLARQAEIIRCSSGYNPKQLSEWAYHMANEMLKVGRDLNN